MYLAWTCAPLGLLDNDPREPATARQCQISIIGSSSVEAASLPWAFTQHQPLSTADFLKEAGRRGVRLDLLILRELHRRGIVEPFVYVSNHRVGPVPAPVGEEPRRGGTLLQQLRYGRDRGRLDDPATSAFRPRLRFDHPDGSAARGWWNGLLYSWYQLLACPELDGLLAHRKGWRTATGVVIVRLPEPGPIMLDRAARLRTMAVVLTALEARYLPVLDPEWLQLINADQDEWQRYRDGFDPVAASAQLGCPATQARQDAEWLLSWARNLDPVGDSWSQLIWRRPRLSGRSRFTGWRFECVLPDAGQVKNLPGRPKRDSPDSR